LILVELPADLAAMVFVSGGFTKTHCAPGFMACMEMDLFPAAVITKI